MKRLVMVAVVVALALPAVAWGSGYTSSFAPGNYSGKITSVIPELNNKAVTGEVKQLGDKVVMTVKYEGGEEVWTISDTKLDQTEKGPPVQTYGATAAANPAGAKQTYNINCADKAAGKCDAGVDPRNYWLLESSPTKISYKVFGVDPKKKDDKALAAGLRHTFEFNKAAK